MSTSSVGSVRYAEYLRHLDQAQRWFARLYVHVVVSSSVESLAKRHVNFARRLYYEGHAERCKMFLVPNHFNQEDHSSDENEIALPDIQVPLHATTAWFRDTIDNVMRSVVPLAITDSVNEYDFMVVSDPPYRQPLLIQPEDHTEGESEEDCFRVATLDANDDNDDEEEEEEDDEAEDTNSDDDEGGNRDSNSVENTDRDNDSDDGYELAIENMETRRAIQLREPGVVATVPGRSSRVPPAYLYAYNRYGQRVGLERKLSDDRDIRRFVCGEAFVMASFPVTWDVEYFRRTFAFLFEEPPRPEYNDKNDIRVDVSQVTCDGCREMLESQLCVGCNTMKIRTLFQPCGHAGFCFGCANKANDDTCPFCRAVTTGTMPFIHVGEQY